MSLMWLKVLRQARKKWVHVLCMGVCGKKTDELVYHDQRNGSGFRKSHSIHHLFGKRPTVMDDRLLADYERTA